jgi:hypothetical protein
MGGMRAHGGGGGEIRSTRAVMLRLLKLFPRTHCNWRGAETYLNVICSIRHERYCFEED